MSDWRALVAARLRALKGRRVAAGRTRWRVLGLTAGFLATLLLLGGGYGALVAANSRIPLDFSLPAEATGAARGAVIVSARLDALAAQPVLPILPSFRRARAPFLREGAERAIADAAGSSRLPDLAARAAAGLRRESLELGAVAQTPLEREARLAHARGSAWAWALMLDAEAGADPDPPALDAARAALESAAGPDPVLGGRGARRSMIARLDRAADLLDAVGGDPHRARRLPSAPS